MLDNQVENIRQNTNIVDIISSYNISLNLRGKNYFGICPFHEDHSPSMSVSPSKQIYKCFSCGASGNVFTFVKEYENVSFLEAVKIVAEKSGLNFNFHLKKEKDTKYNQEYEIMALALKFYQNNIYVNEALEARNYLQQRFLDDEAIKTFDLGYALNKDQALSQLLLKKNYDINLLDKLGIIKKEGTKALDMFVDRIIFPIHNLDGKVVGFTARSLKSTKTAKYINSKESVIFKKGTILFNYHRALSEIKRRKEVLIVEGNMDAIRVYVNGIKNVIALMGTALTTEQIKIIKNLRAKVILMLDNDEAGEKATLSNGDLLAKENILVQVVRLTDAKDPDEYILKKGIEALQENIAKPLNFLDFKLNFYKKNKDLTKTEDLVTYIKLVIDSLKDIDDDLLKQITLQKISQEYQVDINLLKEELNKNEKPKQNVEKKVLETKKLTKYEKAASNVLFYMMNDVKFILRFQKDLGYFKIKEYRSIANEISYYYETHKTINLADFLSFVSLKDYIYDSVLAIIKNGNTENLNMEDFEWAMEACKKEEKNEQIKDLKLQIAQELDQNKKLELAKKLVEIKKGCVKYE